MNLVWKILDAVKLIENDVVVKTVVSCQGELDGLIDRVIREVMLNTPENIDTMVPFKEITEEQLIGWVKDVLTVEVVAEIEQGLTDRLTSMQARKAAITTTNGLPWNQK
jgi:hypothetical protein